MRTKRCARRGGRLFAAVLLYGAAILGVAHAAPVKQPDVRIGWTAWSDAEAVSKMAALVLSKSGVDVELTLADISAQYRGLADNNLDVMLMSWQPKTHASYLEKYKDQMEDLGVLYDGANLGLAVPDYVDPSIKTIGDLADHPEMFGGKIEGIDKGAGISKLTRKAIKAYGLDDYKLVQTSGPAMAKRLGIAAADKKPIVVTAWHPLWIWSEYKLRYLKDPKGIYKGSESIHAMARKGFSKDKPRLASFFSHMHFTVEELESLMAAARTQGERPAIRAWLNAHKDRVNQWLQPD